MENTNQVEYFMEDILIPKFNQIYYFEQDCLHKLEDNVPLTIEFVTKRHQEEIDEYEKFDEDTKEAFCKPEAVIEINDDKLIVIKFWEIEGDPHTYIQSK